MKSKKNRYFRTTPQQAHERRLGLAVERIGERKVVVDIFSLLLGVIAVFVVGTITKTVLAQPKVWDPDDWILEEIKEGKDYDEMRKENPHIWIDLISPRSELPDKHKSQNDKTEMNLIWKPMTLATGETAVFDATKLGIMRHTGDISAADARQ